MGKTPTKKTINNVKYLREAQGLSIRELADSIGISYPQISIIEQGGSPRWSTVATLADFFKVSTDYLMGRTSVSAVPQSEFTPEEISLAFKFIREIRKLDQNTLEKDLDK
jgi:transcriptional regulator with XRE-family HTH domain